METKIFINSNLLRQPQLFDNLGILPEKERKKGKKLLSPIGRLARDLMIYAAWNGTPVVRVLVPEFCAMFGYDKGMLLRKATDEQKQEMRECSLPERLIKPYSNFLGYTLVRMANYAFLWNARGDNSTDTSVRPHRIVEEIEAFRVNPKGTYAEFIVSKDLIGQNRTRYQPIVVEDYLNLTTEKGYAWEAARKLYLRLAWKRHWWDHLEKSGKLKPGDTPSHDQYLELVSACGYDHIKPLRKQASMLLSLLRTVGQSPSVCMVPTMSYVVGRYYVTWRRYEEGTVGGPPKHELFPMEPAPTSWSKDPNAPVLTDEHEEFASTAWKPAPIVPVPAMVANSDPTMPALAVQPKVASPKAAAAPTPKPAAAPQPKLRTGKLSTYERKQLANDLDDCERGLAWAQSDEGKATFAGKPQSEYQAHLEQIEAKMRNLRRQLEEK